jgi:hypothetical protein
MSTPTSDRKRSAAFAAGILALGMAAANAACSQADGDSGGSGSASPTPSGSPATASLSCAVNGALGFTETCTAERVLVDGDPVLVIRHADGGFRRFDVLPGGTLAAADGALPATVLRDGDTLEVTIGSDRYRLGVSLAADAS